MTRRFFLGDMNWHQSVLGALFLALSAIGPAAAPTRAADSAVVFMYHRFGEGGTPSTNIKLEQFEAHLAEIASGPYSVLPLPEIIAAFRGATPLPERAIAITVDDAYLSVYTEAWPRLKAAGLPFTLFIATEPVDQGLRGYMNWEQIRELARSGVSIGSQTATHLHMAGAKKSRNAEDIAKSNRRFEAELGFVPKLFAYPYGEYGLEVQDVVREAGFEAAFGQHSGVAHAAHDRYGLPRFALNETYGGGDRFRLAANALPLRMSEITPRDTLLTTNPPAFGFTVESGLEGLNQLACYASHQPGAARIERLGERRVEIRLSEPFPAGRGRVNCTMPAGEKRWRWYGIQFFIP